MSTSAFAAEYCLQQYDKAITNVNAKLGALNRRQDVIDRRVGDIYKTVADLSAQMAEAAAKNSPDIPTVQRLGLQIGD
jgi:prefoldin subunit 5